MMVTDLFLLITSMATMSDLYTELLEDQIAEGNN